jgi:Ni/Co efflux regulator RcnB
MGRPAIKFDASCVSGGGGWARRVPEGQLAEPRASRHQALHEPYPGFVAWTPARRTMHASESREYPMKTTTIACAVLAGTFGFGTLASAQDWRGGHNDRNGDQRTEQRHDRQDRRDDNRNWRQDRREDRGWNNQGTQQRGYVVDQPRYVYNQPGYAYTAPQYYSHAPRYYRGGYLPRQYLGSSYYVNNWQAYPGMYAPPYGHQWVNVGGDFVLVALATGLIANLLVN